MHSLDVCRVFDKVVTIMIIAKRKLSNKTRYATAHTNINTCDAQTLSKPMHLEFLEPGDIYSILMHTR
jgi:hypothetical protein